MEKYGNINDKTKSDFDLTKKAEYFDAEGFGIADASNKHELKAPKKIDTLNDQD